MKIHKLKSYAKINITLNVVGKFKHIKMHKTESIVSFIQLADIIRISEVKLNRHLISFNGKFSKGIPSKNTVSKVLNLLDEGKYLFGKKYHIKITKNIPQKSGMGGGSMNAATILNFFLKKKIIKLNEAKNFANEIGSDVILGLNNRSKILYCDNSLKKLNKKIRFNLVLVKPKFGCSTKKIYSKNVTFSKQQYFKKRNLTINNEYLLKSKNDLENSAFRLYPGLGRLKDRLLSLKLGKFVRMTGSGSTIVIYFNSKVLAKNAFKIYKRKLNKNWCILSKII